MNVINIITGKIYSCKNKKEYILYIKSCSPWIAFNK